MRPAFGQDVGPGDYLDRGLRAYREGNLDQAAKELRRAVGLDPRLTAAHYHLAKIFLIRKETYRAFYALREVLALEPGNSKSRKLLSELSAELLALIQSDIRARRNLACAYNVLGFLLISQNRLGEGIRREEYALKIDPKMAEAYDDLSWAAYRDRDLERAFQMASKAFELNPVKGSISAHYQQLFNLKRAGVPFPAVTSTRASHSSTSPVGSIDADQGGPSLGSGGTVGAISLLRESDVERIEGEDERLIGDYLKNARLFAPAPRLPSPEAPVSSRSVTPSPAAPLEARRKQVAFEAQRALQEKYDLALKREREKRFPEALELYNLVYNADRSFLDTAVRISELRRLKETLDSYEDAVSAIKKRHFEGALVGLRDLDRRALLRARGIDSVDDLIGEANLGAHQYEAAKVAFVRYLKDHQDKSRPRFLLVKTLRSLGQYSEALDETRLLMDKDPSFCRENQEISTLWSQLWLRVYWPALILLAFLGLGGSSGYAYVKFKKGSRSRMVRRLIDRVQSRLEREKWTEVVHEVESAASLNLTKPEEVFLGCAAATALLYSGDLPKAQKLQRELLEAHPDEPQVHHLTARVMLACKDFSQEAIEKYENLLSVEPNNRVLLEALNSHYQIRAPESEQSAKILDRLLALDPTSSEFRYYRAQRFLRDKEFSDVGREAYALALEADPSRADVRIGLARCHFEAKNYLEAIKEAKKGMESDLKSPELHRILISSYLKLSMREEAIKEYRTLATRHPELPALKTTLLRLADLRDGEFEDEQVSGEAEALLDKGVRLYQEARYKDAIGPLTAAFNTDHLRLSAGTLLVRCYLKTRETKTALGLFERIEIWSQKSPDEFVLGLCYDVADLYVKQGQKDRAAELYTFICKANVSYKDTFHRLEILQPAAARA